MALFCSRFCPTREPTTKQQGYAWQTVLKNWKMVLVQVGFKSKSLICTLRLHLQMITSYWIRIKQFPLFPCKVSFLKFWKGELQWEEPQNTCPNSLSTPEWFLPISHTCLSSHLWPIAKHTAPLRPFFFPKGIRDNSSVSVWVCLTPSRAMCVVSSSTLTIWGFGWKGGHLGYLHSTHATSSWARL